MTREEVIAYWKQRSEHIHNWLEENEDVDFIGEYVEAIDMAIEALSEAQVDVGLINKDAVSREGLLKSWEELSPRGRTEFDQVIMTIPALPSAKGGDAQMNEVNPKQYMQQSPNGADLISRQDAINTLETEERNTDRAEDVSGLTLAKFLIDALPSAVQGWIPCSDRLPKTGDDILVTFSDGEVDIIISARPKAWVKYEEANNLISPVAWMPLPMPYREENEE